MAMAQGGRRRGNQNKAAKARQGLMDTLKMGVVMALVVVAVIVFIRVRQGGVEATFSSGDSFLDGIFVNGTSLSGLTYDQGYELVHQQIEQRLATPITLSYEGQVWTITPKELDAQMKDVDGKLALAWNFGHVGSRQERKNNADYLKSQGSLRYDSELTYDEQLLDDFVEGIKQQIDIRPVNAQAIPDLGEFFKYTNHEDGRALDKEEVIGQVKDAIELGTSANIQLVPQVWPAKITRDIVEQVTVKIGECSTDPRSATENRTKNIKRALEPFNGLVVQPGERISFNGTVGKRTESNGFFEAPEFLDGALAKGIGGGTCQASSMLYGALIRAGVTVEKRTQHSMLVAYVQPSLDATVTDSGIDLVFFNNTEYPIYIFTYVGAQKATVSVYGRRPDYRIEFKSKTVSEELPKGYIKKLDTKRKHVKNPEDPPVLYKEGKNGKKTQGWVYEYDWDTGGLHNSYSISDDYYKPMQPTYWVYDDSAD